MAVYGYNPHAKRGGYAKIGKLRRRSEWGQSKQGVPGDIPDSATGHVRRYEIVQNALV